MAGQPYHECDMTSPSATVLVRQYQNAILSPIFRVHQMHGIPRFPFLWGGAEHAAAFHAALNLRYALIPHLYSLAHSARRDLTPLAAPASIYFSGEGPLDATYVFGGTLLPSEVSVARLPDVNENVSTVFLPPGAAWYELNTTTALPGGQRITRENVPLSDFVIYVREGSLVATQGGPPIQSTEGIGGTLVLHVYAGRDTTFSLFEDDGESLQYEVARETALVWSDAARTLTWSVSSNGFAGGPADFINMTAVLFTPNASAPVVKEGLPLRAAGSVVF
jgi:alpha-D-xyloside xylohydrolase